MVIRRAYGIAGSAMSNAERFQYRFAWPSGDWGSLPIEGGVEVAYKSELEAAADPAAHLAAIRDTLADTEQRHHEAVAEAELDIDSAASPIVAGGGHGLRGMQERVALLAGSLTFGPDPAGGWTVSAVLPWGDAGEESA